MAPGFNAGPSAMLPAEKPRTSGATFPYIGLAVAVLALYAILAVVSPPSAIRSVVAIAAFFAMGYCALALIAGNRLPMSPAEILAFTVGLTIILTSVSALAVSIAHIPITEFAVVTIGLPIAVVAFLVRRPGGRPWASVVAYAKGLFDFSDYSPGEKGVVAALFIAVVGATAFLLSTAALQFPVEHEIAFGITGPDGTANSLPPPRSFASREPKNLTVTALGNATSGTFTLRIRLVPTNVRANDTYVRVPAGPVLHFDATVLGNGSAAYGEYTESIFLPLEGTWTQTYSILVDAASGTFFLTFSLAVANNPKLVREVSLPVDMT